MRAAGQPTQGTRPHHFYAASSVKPARPFQCGVSDLGDPSEVQAIIQQLESQRAGRKQAPAKVNLLPTITHNPPDIVNPFGPIVSSDTIEVRVALEGDYELFLAMGSEQAALNH